MSGVRTIVAAAAVSAAAACSLLVDTDGLSGGDDDGGADALVAAPPPPAPNPPPPSQVDAGADAAPTPRVCDATFCDDFDDGGLGARWTSTNVANGALLGLDDAGLSPPFALGMHLPTRAGGPTRRAQLVKRLGPFPKKLLCTTRLRVETTVDTGEGYGLFIVRPSPNDGPWSFELKIRPTNTIQAQEGYDVPDAGSKTHNTNVTTVATGAWIALSVEIDWPTQALVAVGATETTIPFVAGQASTDDGGATDLDVGLGEDGDADLAAFDALYDDFACTLTP